MEAPQEKIKNTLISKKKYNAFMAFLNKDLDLDTDKSDYISSKFCEIMNFNPNAITYNKINGEHHNKWRKNKATELGVSLRDINKGIKTLKVNQ